MSKRCELQKEYYQANGNYKGSGKYSDEYVMWLENEVLALRQPLVISSVCVSCDEEKEIHEICMDCITKLINENKQTDL
jgi:uncharacterized protein (UPF0303 family)